MAASDNARQLRHSADAIRDCLDQLDSQGASRPDSGARAADRFRYRMRALIVELRRPDGSWEPHAVPTRNLSRRGIAFLTGQFVYPGCECKVHLVSVHNQRVAVAGKVARCRYIQGSGSLHEVGVRFDQGIDVAMFKHGVASLRVLVVDDEVILHRLFAYMLRPLDVKLTCVTSGAEALEAIEHEEFEVVLLDLHMHEMDGWATAEELRKRGCRAPLVGLTEESSDETQRKCDAAGIRSVLTKPITAEALTEMIMSLRMAPVVSTFIHDREMVPVIDAFVASLGSRIREAQTALGAGQLDTVQRIARGLKGEGASFGFEAITNAARDLQAAIETKAELEVVSKKLDELRRWCAAARPASCEADASEAEKRRQAR